jgi:transposase
MFKTREILRLRWAQAQSVRQTARALGVSVGVVSGTARRARSRGLDWAAVERLSDAQLRSLVYASPTSSHRPRPEPNPSELHVELRRPGVTLELLHLEYLAAHPDGLQYTAFCERYRRWRKRRSPWMRQVHRAGEKAFVDFSGKRPVLTCEQTGETRPVELFIGVLGASNYTFVEAVASQKLEDWVGANRRMLEFFGGVPDQLVPDQLRSAVSAPSRDEPGIQRTYAEFARHYGTAIVPARPRKPRDKAKAEVAVQIAQRWILARLRNETFFDLAQLNGRIAELLEELNSRPMKQLGGVTRRELFERLDVPALRGMPDSAFTFASWKHARVNLDYHIALHGHLYSVPHELVQETVELRATASTVEVFYRGQRVASHARDDAPHAYSTDRAHMPVNHQQWVASDPGEVLSWAQAAGPHAEAFMRRLLDDSNPVPQQRWRSARGLKRIGEQYPAKRVEAACEMALKFGGNSYRAVERILRLGRDKPGERGSRVPIDHDNVRGPKAFDLN